MHTERISYESFDILLGLEVPLDPVRSAKRFAAGRGGHCFELNGTFATLLRDLGFNVRLHRAGVQFRNEMPKVDGMHVTISVHGLLGGDPGVPQDVVLVDVGLGDGLHGPVLLRPGTHTQGPFSFNLGPSSLGEGTWRLDHDVRGSFLGMDFSDEQTTLSAFADQNQWIATSPDSFLRHVCVLARRDAGGKDVLNALELRRVGQGPDVVTVLTDEKSWWDVVADVFGVKPAFTHEQRQRLWRTVVDFHERNVERSGSTTA